MNTERLDLHLVTGGYRPGHAACREPLQPGARFYEARRPPIKGDYTCDLERSKSGVPIAGMKSACRLQQCAATIRIARNVVNGLRMQILAARCRITFRHRRGRPPRAANTSPPAAGANQPNCPRCCLASVGKHQGESFYGGPNYP